MTVEEVVQKRYRITIPAEFRERLHIKEGDRVRVKLDGGRLVIEPHWLVTNPTEKLASLGAPKRTVTEPEELEEKIRRGRLREGWPWSGSSTPTSSYTILRGGHIEQSS